MKTALRFLCFQSLAVLLFCTGAHAATLTIGPKGEFLLFDKTTLTVKAGEKVKLTFKNTSAMQHNWVLTAPGTAEKVAQDSIAAGATKGWLAVGPNVLAHTKLVDGKQSDTIEFTAPAKAGDYPYICTFPGHAGTMKGILTVK
ncbi:MAG TPA: plastocyanin/azurin family copper-binding protein [Bdellovibrionales bacterium]|nr:plastocyanin/azurin family copper-binding protein [Bdellovibrionales bacterium]